MPDAVVIENVMKRFGEIEALRGLSMSIRQGEIYGVLGPNGEIGRAHV